MPMLVVGFGLIGLLPSNAALVTEAVTLAPEGSAKGVLTIGSEKVVLTYAYAVEHVQIPQIEYPIWPKRSVAILMSDRMLRALDREARVRPAPWLGRSDLEAERHVHDVNLLLRVQEDATGWSGALHSLGLTHRHGQSAELFGTGAEISDDQRSREFLLEGLEIEDGTLRGRLATRGPIPFEAHEASKPKTYELDVAFNVRILPSPAITEVLTGEAAARSAQVQTVTAFCEALRSGDVEALRKLVDPRGVTLKQVEGPRGSREWLPVMAAEIPLAPDAAVSANVENVTIFGDLALVVLKGAPMYGTHWWMALRKTGMAWTIDDR